ncbi:MAG: hypothetical protein ACRC30_14370 [Clostridium sp.]
MSKVFFIGLILSTLMIYLILVNYKKIKFNKKYSFLFFVLEIILLFINILVKNNFIANPSISSVILSIITPTEIAIFTYFGIFIVRKKKEKRLKNK